MDFDVRIKIVPLKGSNSYYPFIYPVITLTNYIWKFSYKFSVLSKNKEVHIGHHYTELLVSFKMLKRLQGARLPLMHWGQKAK